jgi:hypothetical protein
VILFFFSLFEEQDDPVAIVNELFENNMHAANCLILDYITKFILLNLLAHYNPVQLVS